MRAWTWVVVGLIGCGPQPAKLELRDPSSAASCAVADCTSSCATFELASGDAQLCAPAEDPCSMVRCVPAGLCTVTSAPVRVFCTMR